MGFYSESEIENLSRESNARPFELIVVLKIKKIMYMHMFVKRKSILVKKLESIGLYVKVVGHKIEL